MEVNTLVSGFIIKRMGRVFFITQMAISIRVSGSTIRPTARAPFFTRMKRNMWEIGKMTSNTGKELRSGLMDRGMKGSLKTVKNLEKGSCSSKTGATTRDNSSTTQCMVKVVVK